MSWRILKHSYRLKYFLFWEKRECVFNIKFRIAVIGRQTPWEPITIQKLENTWQVPDRLGSTQVIYKNAINFASNFSLQEKFWYKLNENEKKTDLKAKNKDQSREKFSVRVFEPSFISY